MENLKFTKEIKENWLAALKSGKYVQGEGRLRREDEGICKHCCLGVLADIHPALSISEDGRGCTNDTYGYSAFESMLTSDTVDELWQTNDNSSDGKYTSVIPLIEAIPTEDEN